MEYRPLLEVFKWLSLEEILLRASFVSRLWRQVSNTDELWIHFCEAFGFSPVRVSNSSCKQIFKTQFSCSTYLCLLTSDHYWIYDCRKEIFIRDIRLSTSLEVNSAASSTFLPDGSFLCSGGSNPQSPEHRAYHVQKDGTVRATKNMLLGRSEHGLIACLDSIYAFGGWGGNRVLRECEKLPLQPIETLETRDWKRVPDMLTPRCFFTPCAYAYSIYLCGGGTEKSERFDPKREEFSPLEFKLPDTYGNHCAVINCEDLIVLSEASVSRLKLGAERGLFSLSHTRWFPRGHMNGILVGSALFTPLGTVVRRFDIVSMKMIEISPTDRAVPSLTVFP